MFDFLFKSPAWQLVIQADTMTKFVLMCLFSVSVFCVWIVLCKFIAFRREKKAMNALFAHIRKARSFEDLLELSKRYRESVGGRLLLKGLSELKDILDAERVEGAEGKVSLSAGKIEHFQLLLDQSVDHILSEEEHYLPVLGTSAAVAPLIGLFGTIWGLVHAFVDISQHKSADISVVAPGIAEALVTTLAGLIVAIPALIFFHYFTNQLRRMELQLVSMSDRVLALVKQTFVR